MHEYPQVLLISNEGFDSRDLEGILRKHAVVTRASNLPELRILLQRSAYDAAFCEWSLQKCAWSAAMDQLQSECPNLPVIVFSRMGGEEEWVEVLQAGGFDLLVPPYHERTVLPVLEHAVASHEARRFHRAELHLVSGKAG